MGIIKAAAGAIGGALGDQWLETVEPEKIDNSILATYGTIVRKNDRRNSNRKGTEDVISNGSIIHVPENTYMLLVDGGKIISATDEAGYYQVDDTRAPSVFFKSEKDLEGYHNTGTGEIQRAGGIKNTLKDSWERFKFGGVTPLKQRVIYINKMEIPDIKFGTRNPVPYTDRVLIPGRTIPCKVTSFGTYSIKVSDPMLFYSEVCNKTDKVNLHKEDLAEQYINEFLMAYQTALASLSLENVMVSDIPISTSRLGKYMADELDDEWLSKRGFFIQSVGIAGISFDEQTDKLLANYGQDSLLLDPNARAARMTGGIAEGLKNAGSNEGGAMMGFAGIGMGMNAAGGLGGVLNPQGQGTPTQQPFAGGIAQGGPTWQCEKCHAQNAESAKFCAGCGTAKSTPVGWTCTCGHQNTGKFCSNCGGKKPEATQPKCKECGFDFAPGKEIPKFCPNCGASQNA